MLKSRVWINGKLVESGKAKVSIFDRGFMYGDGCFETMRSYAGTVFKLDAHMKRLFASLSVLGIRPPCAGKRLGQAVYATLKANGLKSAYVKVAVTRGEGRFGISHKDVFAPNTIIVAKEFEGYPAWMFSKGISAKVTGNRQNEQSVLSRVKSMNFLAYILARSEAKEMGYDEAILANTKGHIAEAATSNIFLVRNGALSTPSLLSGIVPGITRGVVIGIARKLGLPVKERAVTPGELVSADEVFLTNSLAEVLPVRSVNGRCIGSGSPGEITKLLRMSYQKQVIREVLQ